MQHLYFKKLKECSYETLEFEFIPFFGSNEPRTLKRYLGTVEHTVYSSGKSLVRMNRTSGKVANFDYMNHVRIRARPGLLEQLGYIERVKNGKQTRFVLHHERMPYFTIQEILPNILPEMNVSDEVSIDNTCVRPLYDRGILQGKECEKTVLEVVSPSSIETKETVVEKEQRERDVIDCTHTCNLTPKVKLTEIMPKYAHGMHEQSKGLTSEEYSILYEAKPCEEPDRSKPIRRVQE